MGSFVLLEYVSLAASTTLLQPLPAWLSFRLLQIQKIYSVGTNDKKDFYELRQQHKQLKTIEMSEAWPDIFYEGYIHQLQPEPTHKTP